MNACLYTAKTLPVDQTQSAVTLDPLLHLLTSSSQRKAKKRKRGSDQLSMRIAGPSELMKLIN